MAMYVCHCRAVTGRAVRAAIASGARSIADITASCHAGRGCGGCWHMLQAYLDALVGADASADGADSAESLLQDAGVEVVDVSGPVLLRRSIATGTGPVRRRTFALRPAAQSS